MRHKLSYRRKKEGLFGYLSKASWQVGIGLGFGLQAFVWFVFDYIHMPYYKTHFIVQYIDEALHQPLIKYLSLIVSIVCVVAGLKSFLAKEKRGYLLEQQNSLESIKRISWQSFEKLVGEAYKRLGYEVHENGLGGSDGGVDLILKKESQVTIVQCKQWKNTKVGAPIVRELYGLMIHHNASSVKIVTTGAFTKEALGFAKGKPIELVTGEDLLFLIKSVQTVK